MNRFENTWDDWAALCVNPGIKPAALVSLRVAFYSGAMAWAGLVRRIVTEEGPAAAQVVLNALLDEMIEFADEQREVAGAQRGPKEYTQ